MFHNFAGSIIGGLAMFFAGAGLQSLSRGDHFGAIVYLFLVVIGGCLISWNSKG